LIGLLGFAAYTDEPEHGQQQKADKGRTKGDLGPYPR
jgi:hypothetical protein